MAEMADTHSQPGGFKEPPSQSSSVSLVDTVLSSTPELVYGLAVVLILLYFVLASGDAFLNKMVQVTPRLQDKKRVVATARDIQRDISVYLGTITLINLALAFVVATAMYLLDMPNPLLWGAMVGMLNFIPYLGVAVSVLIVGFVSLLTFDSISHALLPPLAIFLVNVIEGQFLTPIIVGRRLSLSPIAVFLSLVVLGWIWGIIGLLMAVPIIATIKLICEEIEPLNNVATFLGRH
jgi:predicted PurR-regulated permease PerM